MEIEQAKLLEKIAKIEALFAGATTDGEKAAAASARERIIARLRATEALDPPLEWRFTFADKWSNRLFVALMRRYDLVPYRYSGQKYTTVMARVSKKFVDEVLWPQHCKLHQELDAHLAALTNKVISQALHADTTDAVERAPLAIAGA